MDCNTSGFPVLHYLSEFAQTHVSIELVMPFNNLIFCHPLLLLSLVFPGIRLFSSESALPITWPKYWSFSFSISPSNEYSGLISFSTDWFDLLAVQGTLKSLLQQLICLLKWNIFSSDIHAFIQFKMFFFQFLKNEPWKLIKKVYLIQKFISLTHRIISLCTLKNIHFATIHPNR